MSSTPPPEYVLVRSALLDALGALHRHLDALVLVGAQAVYLHTGDAELIVVPTTTDADLALYPPSSSTNRCLRTRFALQASSLPPTREPGEDASASRWT